MALSLWVDMFLPLYSSGKETRNNAKFCFSPNNIFIPFLIIGLFVPAVNYRYLFPSSHSPPHGIFVDSHCREKWGYIISTGIALLQCRMLASEWRVLPPCSLRTWSGSRTRWIPFYTPQPDFRSAFLFLKTQKNRRNSCHSLPRNRSFYGVNADATFLFDWNERANEWKDIQRARYLNLPHIASEEELETLLHFAKSGFVLLDSFALERMPLEAARF